MLERAMALEAEVVELRRTIHRQPELGFQEFKTAALVSTTLQSLGIRVRTGVGKTGVVGYLGDGGPTVAIRADMDALPIEELNDVPYRSEVPGAMHACGHDAHVAMLLGVAMLLSDTELPGQVRFLFQPSEESQDEEGKSGAALLVDDGAMEGVDAVIALHVHDEVDTGLLKISPGPICAAVDVFDGTIRGEGCHGAYPHLGLDPVFLAGQVISSVQGIVSRRIDPTKTAVVSIGAIQGGTTFNVIPSEVQLKGTIRTFEEDVREQVHLELERAFGVAQTLGGDYAISTKGWIPAVVNDPSVTEVIRQVGSDLLGRDSVLSFEPEMGGEDFALLAREAPGALFGLGVRKGETRQAHSPHFDIDENALHLGVAMLAETAKRMLSMLAG